MMNHHIYAEYLNWTTRGRFYLFLHRPVDRNIPGESNKDYKDGKTFVNIKDYIIKSLKQWSVRDLFIILSQQLEQLEQLQQLQQLGPTCNRTSYSVNNVRNL